MSDELDDTIQSGLAFGFIERAGVRRGEPLYRHTAFAVALFEGRLTPDVAVRHIIEHYEAAYGPEGHVPAGPRYADRKEAHDSHRALYDLARAGQGGALIDVLTAQANRPIDE